MEKFNNYNSESFCNSDTDSADGENDLLYEFIFGKKNKRNQENDAYHGASPYENKKSGNKQAKNAFKNGRMNAKMKKTLQGVKRDTESPYRKVVVTTDLKSNSKSSKYSHIMIKFNSKTYFRKCRWSQDWLKGRGTSSSACGDQHFRLGHWISSQTSHSLK